VEHKRVAHPGEYTFEIDTPLHGKAYWTAVEVLARPGRKAVIHARAEARYRAHFATENIAEFVFFPDSEVFDLSRPLEVLVNDVAIFSARCGPDQELRIRRESAHWEATLEPRRVRPLEAWHTHPVARAPEAVGLGGTEAKLGNWITDAMRDATGADIALYRAARSSP